MDAGEGLWLASPRGILTVAAALVVGAALVRRLWLDRAGFGEALFRVLGRLEMFLLAGLIATMIILAALQIVLRNVAGAGLLWIDPMLRYLTLWIGFFGAAYATSAGRHIQIDALARVSPPGVRAWAGRFVSLVAAVVTLILAETAYRHVVDEHAFGATAFLDLPTWGLLLVMPVAFVLMSYRFFYRAIAAEPPVSGEHEMVGGHVVEDAGS